ncbi:gene transfer agent family protein [Ketogulonicigenium vulgare]|uniref:Putative gene transfer agent protein n=1 Tax=Ketogulonicigenium vulgare (strain WSH-001) TaxID=759362 RepID=F9Y461_KETVW|nr:gene transfer agent family protein [Ketogulonicigenium vulgare]ADO42303.1 conserved hypothetical protein [Ketogulonicigenium vulgare Y25]AEM40497.1 putative gene transfer agent protein [Ketogulonicigenium vulgare WSH-001]ALJ80682.1 hypothetical protein KVH_05505 [Ketogulonicigenium vulgare]ANW33490.1 hypothetical protein KvSKV_05475 [Ketogulonicigenium vulgare]AOZ54214.1 hypothetical protein KVC_1197 [Ketogulonicigenium vulgare]
MSANPHAGEVEIPLDGVIHIGRLTLGALARLEADLQSGNLPDLVARFESGDIRTADVLALIVAGLRGGGWQGTAADLEQIDVGGGPLAAARIAGQLLARAFASAG